MATGRDASVTASEHAAVSTSPTTNSTGNCHAEFVTNECVDVTGAEERPSRRRVSRFMSVHCPKPAPDVYGPVSRAQHRKRKASPLAVGSGATAVVAGTTALAVATVGSLASSEPAMLVDAGQSVVHGPVALTGPDATQAAQKITQPAPVRVQGSVVDTADAQERAVRASRTRAREALADRKKAAEKKAKKEAAEAKNKAAAKARKAREAAIAKNYSLPVKGFRLTGRFGQAGGRWSRNHTGLDFACRHGSPVRAVAAGTVVSAGWDGPYGWKTVIRHKDGTVTWYAHQSSFVVRRGHVDAGQIIGRVGSTGNSTGPHLHLEVRRGDRPMDPRLWLRRHGLHI